MRGNGTMMKIKAIIFIIAKFGIKIERIFRPKYQIGDRETPLHT